MAGSSERLATFVPPRPCPALIRALVPLNRLVCLHGLRGLRAVPILGAIPGIRGLTDITDIDLPEADAARLRDAIGPGRATFLAPNHPEFFTDWMLDKEISARFAPLMASWATHDIVNGMGPLLQRFWLANNLIAQIPGAGGAEGKAHSVRWALAGHGVLLHPEGQVAWTAHRIQPLFPGVVEMARTAAITDPSVRALIVPIVWHLRFTRDVDAGLHRALGYVEGRLGARPTAPRLDAARRLHDVYLALLEKDERTSGFAGTSVGGYAPRWRGLVDRLVDRIGRSLGGDAPEGADPRSLLRVAERRLRQGGAGIVVGDLRTDTAQLRRLLRFDPSWYEGATLTQEQVAENIQRLRIDYCRGTLRDSVHRFIPRPVGPRQASIRIGTPLALRGDAGDDNEASAALHERLQSTLSGLIAEQEASRPALRYRNPFQD